MKKTASDNAEMNQLNAYIQVVTILFALAVSEEPFEFGRPSPISKLIPKLSASSSQRCLFHGKDRYAAYVFL